LRELQGVRTKLKDLEIFLIGVGAVDEKDMRLREGSDDEETEAPGRQGLQSKKAAVEDEDDDWD